MDFYTEDLIDEINSNGECNFIACAVTFLHAVGINATIKRLLDEGIRLSGYVLILAHPTTGRILNESNFQLSNTDIIVRNYTDRYRKYHHSPAKDRLLALKESFVNNRSSRIYILWTELDYKWYEILNHIKEKHQLCYIKIDDGGGSYVDRFKNDFQTEVYERQGSRLDKCKIFYRIFIRYSFNKFLQSELKSHCNYIDNRIFRISKDSRKIFIPNKKIIPYYKSEFKRIGNTVSKEIISICSNSVLINTQCLIENKMIDDCIDLNLYEEVVDLAKKANLVVTLKPHPRELNVDKYEHLGIVLIPSKISQEAVLANLKEPPKCIISIFSSTLLNAWGLFNIPTISLAKLMLKNDLNKEFRKQLEDFIKQYNNLFIFPESYRELENIIRSL